MRCLIFNTKEISFKKGDPANRPIGIKHHPSNDEDQLYNDVSVIFTCIEKNDNGKDVEFIANEIEVYHSRTKKDLLVVPFAHLSSNIPVNNIDLAPKLIDMLVKALINRSLKTNKLGFGYDRAIISKWITVLHKGNVAFRDSKFNKSE